MGNPQIPVGLNQCLIQHLLLLIAHIRYQKGKENHQLLYFPCQHGIHLTVIHLVNQLHLRCDGVPNFHDVDTVRGTGGNLDKLTPDLVTCPSELMPLDWCNDKTLDTTHLHPQS